MWSAAPSRSAGTPVAASPEGALAAALAPRWLRLLEGLSAFAMSVSSRSCGVLSATPTASVTTSEASALRATAPPAPPSSALSVSFACARIVVGAMSSSDSSVGTADDASDGE